MTDSIVWTPVTVGLASLTPWERNPKRISRTHAARLLDLWERLGQFQTIAIGPAGEVYDGHQRLSVLKAAHGVRFQVQALQSSRPLTEREREELTVAAHVGTVGQFDWDALSGWDAGNLQAWGFDDETLADWNAGAAALSAMLDSEQDEPAEDPGALVDRADELRQKWGVETGQLWQLGEHRLICGDCTDAAVVARVMGGEKADMIFTDPPYGHSNNDGDLIHRWEAALGKPKTASSAARPIANDKPEDAARLYGAFLRIASELLKPGCCCCCCCGGGGGSDPQFARWTMEMDQVIGFKMAVVWDKGGLGMGWHYRRSYEFVLVAEKPGAACHWFGDHNVSNVIRGIGKIIPSAEQHPTEKPVELPELFIKLHSQPGEIVWEPFCGSGTTLIACERLGRRCRAIEISPAYCAVAIERWHVMTGLTPVLLDGTG